MSQCQGIVFDEADRLFDMGFQKEIEFILSKAPNERQIIMVSATSNQEVLRTAYKFHSHPKEILLNQDSLVVDQIDHSLAMVSLEEKFSLLVQLLREKEDAYALVFCNTQFQTHLIAEWLKAMNFKARPISGRLPQNKRTKLLQDFRNKKTTVLVCTDVAARGLDIKDVNLVINYDIPIEAANYVHRIGRTGRAGEEGRAISFCAHEDCENLDSIYDFLGESIPKLELTNDSFAKDLCKRPYLDKKTLRPVSRQREVFSQEPVASIKKKTFTPTRKKKLKTSTEPVSSQPVKKQTKEPVMTDRIDRRIFQITSQSFSKAQEQALSFFHMNEEGMLNHEILEKGRKKFLLFGPQDISYKFTIKPIYKKLLLPFLIDILKKADLNLFVKVSFKEPHLRVNFSGKDEKLLTRNRGELLQAFEHIIKLYLFKKIFPHPGMRVSVTAPGHRGGGQKEVNEEKLISLAKNLKSEALEKGSSVQTKTLSPAQRRIIHKHLQDDGEVTTLSIGEGRFKRVEISPLEETGA